MVSVIISDSLKQSYPDAIFGNLIVKNIINKINDPQLERRKRNFENFLRNDYQRLVEDEILNIFKQHFKKWDKSYPIEFQLQSIIKGKTLPQVSVLVDSMFHAELKNLILTSGHDLDQIEGSLIFDSTIGNESFLKINGKDQQLKEGDILLRDDKGILANILYGPAKRTAITMNTKNSLYFAWCPRGIDTNTVKNHLEEILSNLKMVYDSILSDIAIYKTN
ncbi:MAG: hypothetical protein HeimC3_45300 [Candidatus Heimdallarchaeota archaeon LC_3]|nr:MAG: hypothetical protein HeimC3_45300 [Candidatus Heimdallarchaeota archaeon LC_3]